MTTIDYGIVAVYLAAVMLLGAFFFRGQKSLKEFFLAGRTIPWWAAAFSGVATIVSAASYLGGPGQAFKADYTFLQYRLATPFAMAVICLLLIPYFYRLEVVTAYEYLERRFDLKTRMLASLLFILLKSFFLGLVIYAPCLVVAEMSAIPFPVIVVAVGFVTTLYTLLGGMRAVIWTDALQLIVLIGGLAVALFVLVGRVDGGLAGVFSVAETAGKLRFFDFSPSLGGEVTFWGGLIGGAFLMLGQYGVDQAELQRFLTASSVRKSRLAILSTMTAGVVLGFFLFFIGTSLHVFYSQRPELGGLSTYPDRIFPKFIIEELPPGVTGLVIAGVFAASMSTISSVLNSLSTVTISDVYQRLTGRKGSVKGARWTTLTYGVFGTLVGLNGEHFGTILVATSKLTNFFGGTLIGVFLLGILVPRANGSGAFLGALCGFATVISISLLTSVSWIWYGFVGAVMSFSTGMLFSPVFGVRPVEKNLVRRNGAIQTND